MKKALALFLTGSMAISMLTGCGTANSKDTAQQSSPDTSAASTDAGKSETKDTSSGKEVTLKVFDSMAYGLDGYDTVVKAFEAANPGVKVEVQHAANDGTTILQSRFNSGDIPDVFACEPGSSAQSYYEYAYDWSNDTDVLNLFKAGTTDLGKDTTDGKVKGLPWTYENMGLIYNKDCFSKS